MTDRGVFGMRLAGLDRAHHRLAGVHSNPNLQIAPLHDPQPLRILLKVFLHPQCGKQRALRMVFMGQRCAEEREDRVAGGVYNIAVVKVHGIDHDLEGGVDNGASVLRIEAFQQVHRTFDVGKQRREHLALAFHRVTRSGGGTSGQTGSGSGRARTGQWSCALVAEFGARVVRRAALDASQGKRRGAFVAKPETLLIVGLTARATHPNPRGRCARTLDVVRPGCVPSPGVNSVGGSHLLIVSSEPGSAESAALRYSTGTSPSSLGADAKVTTVT